MEDEKGLMQGWEQIIYDHAEVIAKFLSSESCCNICGEYHRLKKQENKDAFNVFSLVSDLYYRENFHSDIIRFFLDTTEKHECGDKFLSLFISMLNALGKTINPVHYQDAVAVREEGRIDILVKSNSSNRAIIIENKINNAGDMPRQMPRYFDYVSPNLTIDAIVYIPLDRSKEPDKHDWTEEDKTKVSPLLIIVPAYDKKMINLVADWLLPAELATDNINIVSTLRQYSQLIKSLNTHIMDTVILEKFYNEIKKESNLKSAISIRNMLNDLPGYLAIRIQDKFGKQCHPFDKIWLNGNRKQDAVFEHANIQNIYVKMDISCYENGYDVIFWTPHDVDETVFSQIVSSIDSLSGFSKKTDSKNCYILHFDFHNEDGLFSFIESLLKELNDSTNN